MSNSLHNVIAQAEQAILGKPHQIRLALACLLACGHLAAILLTSFLRTLSTAGERQEWGNAI